MGCAATTARVHFTDFKNRYIKLDNCVRCCDIIIHDMGNVYARIAPALLAVVSSAAAALAFGACASEACKYADPRFVLTLSRAPCDEPVEVASSNAVSSSVRETGGA